MQSTLKITDPVTYCYLSPKALPVAPSSLVCFKMGQRWVSGLSTITVGERQDLHLASPSAPGALKKSFFLTENRHYKTIILQHLRSPHPCPILQPLQVRHRQPTQSTQLRANNPDILCNSFLCLHSDLSHLDTLYT